MNIKKIWLGKISYSDGMDRQNELAKKLAHGEAAGFLLGMEHPAIVTLGRRFSGSKADFVADFDLDYVFTDRGGEMTLHSEGQLVCYPVVSLNALGISVRDFVCLLESAMIQTAKEFGVAAFRVSGSPGVFTENGKLGFVGIRVQQGIVTHGISFNVSNDLTLFSKITPCGVRGQRMDRLANSCEDLATQDVFETLASNIHSLLGGRGASSQLCPAST